MNPAEAAKFIAGLAEFSGAEPANFEEQALKFVGREIYETFFYGYTKKQWGCEPRELPASILKRLPVRFNYDDNYYASRFQGIPTEGYTEMIRRMLDHPRITVLLDQAVGAEILGDSIHFFYTGCIDEYYGFSEGRLNYRTVHWSRIDAEGDYQGNAVINYCEAAVPHTRIHEHKHFAPWEEHARTVAFVEYSKQTEPADVPYYPMRLPADLKVLDAYMKKAAQEEKVTFLGRLATYRYLDMDKVIGEALDLAAKFVAQGIAAL
jgi:UDP-galactopyranose mutase